MSDELLMMWVLWFTGVAAAFAAVFAGLSNIAVHEELRRLRKTLAPPED